MNTKKILFSSLIAIAFVLAVSTIVIAAVTMTPDAAPNPAVGTMKTLEDIYQRIVAGTEAVAHTLNPASGPAGTMHTLLDIYNAIPTNDKVLYGTNAGTANTPPGSGDMATATEITTGYYAFKADGTSIPGSASIMDCSIPAGSTLAWSADLGTMNWSAGVSACTALGQCWRLPTSTELLNSLNNQLLDSPPTQGGFVDGYEYWSSTPDTPPEWYVFCGQSLDPYPLCYQDNISLALHIRCVR